MALHRTVMFKAVCRESCALEGTVRQSQSKSNMISSPWGPGTRLFPFSPNVLDCFDCHGRHTLGPLSPLPLEPLPCPGSRFPLIP